MRGRLALIACALAAGSAYAEDAGEAAFHDAEVRIARGDPGAIDAFEAIGDRFPDSRWADDAWLEAGRAAVRGGDLVRGRRDLERALAVARDDLVARRARAELARLAAIAGGNGQWAAVALLHGKLESQLEAGGDPKLALAELEALIAAVPGYPRAWTAMLAVARGWERDGDPARALGWLRRAKRAAPMGIERAHAQAELVRAQVRHDALGEAREEIAAIDDPRLVRELRAQLSRAELRRDLRWIAAGILAGFSIAAALALRRSSGSWRAALRRLARPPMEVLFFGPIAVILVIVAETGNPLVARAVVAIAIAGVAIAWVSGALLESLRARHGRVGAARAAGHALAAVLAVAGAVYLAIDRDRVIDLVVETWREGPELR